MIKRIWLIVGSFLITFISSAQLPVSTQKQIDDIFKKWNGMDLPGYAIAIVKDGRLQYSRGYGMANLEYSIPLTPASIFHIASETKQYTAFCIALLAKRGLVGLDDDIRKYLSYVPDFGKTITLRHLITHTSGLRDQWQALAIAGWQLDDIITQDHIIKMVSKQKDLNFPPGDRMLYCNTGYTLLAEVVKKVTGKTLRVFAEEEIFRPLGMTNTHFHDSYTEIVKNRAYSYKPADSIRYVNAPLNYATIGATSLFTTVEDEAKWLINYETAQVGSKEVISQMYQQGVLNNGNMIDYAFGLMIDRYKGSKRIGHGGSDAGYRTYTCRFPESGLGIVVFSNMSTGNCQAMGMKMADVLLNKDTMSDKAAPARVTLDTPPAKKAEKPAPLSANELADFAGTYYNDELEATYRITYENKRLILTHRKYPDSPLIFQGALVFSTNHWWMQQLSFQKDAAGKIISFEITSGRAIHVKFKKA